jgi:hypothetical protein
MRDILVTGVVRGLLMTMPFVVAALVWIVVDKIRFAIHYRRWLREFEAGPAAFRAELRTTGKADLADELERLSGTGS